MSKRVFVNMCWGKSIQRDMSHNTTASRLLHKRVKIIPFPEGREFLSHPLPEPEQEYDNPLDIISDIAKRIDKLSNSISETMKITQAQMRDLEPNWGIVDDALNMNPYHPLCNSTIQVGQVARFTYQHTDELVNEWGEHALIWAMHNETTMLPMRFGNIMVRWGIDAALNGSVYLTIRRVE